MRVSQFACAVRRRRTRGRRSRILIYVALNKEGKKNNRRVYEMITRQRRSGWYQNPSLCRRESVSHAWMDIRSSKVVKLVRAACMSTFCSFGGLFRPAADVDQGSTSIRFRGTLYK